MSDLVAFLTARLDEDEAAAKVLGAVEGHWVVVIPEGSAEPFLASETRGRAYLALPEPMLDYLMHFARHDPARVLREVEAKRAILGRHEPGGDPADYDYGDAPCMEDERIWPCLTVRALAAVYSGHPDYDEAFSPA